VDLKHRLDPEARLGLRFTLAVAAFVLVVVPFGFLLVNVLSDGPVTRWDQRIAHRANTYVLHHPGAVSDARLITSLGSTVTLVVLVALVATYDAISHRRRRPAVFLIATALCGVGLNNLLKVVVGRSRPHFDRAVATGFGKSFPSGHAMNSTVVYGGILVLVWLRHRSWPVRMIAAAAITVVIVSVAVSRVVLGVHYVSDVAAGIVLGAAFVLSSAAGFRIWQSNNP
jgi:membrane-associated phospholipid phosphatase